MLRQSAMPDRLVVSKEKGWGRGKEGGEGGGSEDGQSSTLPMRRGSHVLDRGRNVMYESMS